MSEVGIEKVNEIHDEPANVVVAGDVVIDWLQYESPFRYPISSRLKKEYGGALHLAQMVHVAIKKEVITYAKDNEDIFSNHTTHSISILNTYPFNEDGKSKKVYRRQKFAGYFPPLIDYEPLEIKNDDGNADYILLTDNGSGFYRDRKVWPKAICNEGKSPLVILKMSNEFIENKKDEMKCKEYLCSHLIENFQNNLIIIANAKYLRGENVKISRHLSWEKTAEEFMWQMTYNPNIAHLAKCNNLIVRFGLEGVIHYKCNNDGTSSARLYYFPEYAEDDIKDMDNSDMTGITSVFVAAFFSEIYTKFPNGVTFSGKYDRIMNKITDSEMSSLDFSIDRGIRTAISKSIDAFYNGYGVLDNNNLKQNTESMDEFIPSYTSFEYVLIDNTKMNNYDKISCIDIPPVDNDMYGEGKHWRILDEILKEEKEEVYNDAVKKEIGKVLKNVPVAKFGKLVTVDRNEIESYRSIKYLMSDYIKSNKTQIPLSIAVFGPPGSGKSYGVKQLAGVIDTSDKVPSLEFNVSQFTSINDLTDAFHKIRDVVLKGKIPLVFFDEFDAKYQGDDFGWLKYFLAPMQDGMFKGGETMHPVGKTIFVFAGGTSNTFHEFSKGQLDDEIETIKSERRKLEKEIEEYEDNKKKLEKDKMELDDTQKLLEELEKSKCELTERKKRLVSNKEKTEESHKDLESLLYELEYKKRNLEMKKKELEMKTRNFKSKIEKNEYTINNLKGDLKKNGMDMEKWENENKKHKEQFTNAKGTDFVSRLRGYVNVLGPNRMNSKDELYLIRRAILLRSLLQKNVEQIFNENHEANIADGVLRAFLMVPKYKHGSRSIEAIISMSMLGDSKQYEPASLPSAQQTELHVDSTIFSNLMLNDVLYKKYIDDFAKIDKDKFEEPRRKAEQFVRDLHKIGFNIMPIVGESKNKFDNKQITSLAEKEYERKVDKRIKENWKLRYQISNCSKMPEAEIENYRKDMKELMDFVESKFELYSLVE